MSRGASAYQREKHKILATNFSGVYFDEAHHIGTSMFSKQGWTQGNAKMAAARGWRISMSEGEPSILATSRPRKRRNVMKERKPIFASKEEARDHVNKLVDEGDPLATKAVAVMMRWRMENRR